MNTNSGVIKSLIIVLFFSLTTSRLISQSSSVILAPLFSVTHGFFTGSFDLTIKAQTKNASIRYTLDCSDPRTSKAVLTGGSAITIRIDPDTMYGQTAKTPAVIVRACAVAQDSSMSESITQTYVFTNEVAKLSPSGRKPGIGWPNPTTSSNPQMIDYGMASDVLNDKRYSSRIVDALLSIPTISIATDLKNLFAPDSGIYMNAYNDGIAWERPASIELLNPDGTEGFQINAGLRIRGGASRSGGNPKHAFRFFFRTEYGNGKLDYPLFGNEGVTKFDKVDLRTSQNYSWSFPGHLGEYNTMNRDVFSRDMQREMGQPYTRSRYYHLYLDGAYWGLYQTQERSEANYAASYFGGDKEDYDVIKVDDNSALEATDGNFDAYQQVWDLCRLGFQTNTNYYKIQGLNEDGTRNPDYKVLVDIDNLIDFMLVIFYTGNFDGPTCKFFQNQIPRNFYCIYNRQGNEGFKFFIHDAEHTLRTTAGEGPGIGLFENRVNIGDLNDNDPNKMSVNSFSGFHPQWLHFKLSENAEYRMRFADHVYKHFFNQGCLTPEKTAALFISRTKEIETAIIGESARWGDTYHLPSRNKDDDWEVAVNDIINNYFPYRTKIVINQFKPEGLFPWFDPPVFKYQDTEILPNNLTVGPGYNLKIQKPVSETGTIYFTTDGQDPRAVGGAINSSAVEGGSEAQITVNSTMAVNTRVKRDTMWSALHEITLFVDPSMSSVNSSKDSAPKNFELYQNYPNPYNPSTIISWQLPAGSFVTLKIFDLLGNEIATLVKEYQNAGLHSIPFNIQQAANNSIHLSSRISSKIGYPSGVYFYQLITGNTIITKKMILMK